MTDKKEYKTAKDLQIEEAKKDAKAAKRSKGPQFPSQKKVTKPEDSKQENVAETFKK